MDIIKQFNNGQVIGVANKKDIKDISHMDAPLLRDLDYTDNKKNLGLISLFETMQIVKVPFLKDAIKNADYIYTNGYRGSFQYEVEMDVDYPCVVEDVEADDKLGIDGSVFKIKLTFPFSNGDILTYDPYDGAQVIVADEYEVIDEGNGYVHYVQLIGASRDAYFPKDKLVAGTQYMKIDHVASEYDTKFSKITGAQTPQKVTLEFTLGDIRGVEVAYTEYANSMTINGKESGALLETLTRQKRNYGDHDFLFMGQIKGKNSLKVTKVEDLLAALAMAELQKMTAMGLMFNRGGVITGANGSKRVNEGIYHQLRRGHRWTYNNPKELRGLIQRAGDTIFNGVHVPMHLRKFKFKAGKHAYDEVRKLFKDEFTNTYPLFLNSDAVPVKLLSGNDRYNLTYESFAIGTAFLNGIGNVEIEHDPSLDYDMGDFISRGYSAGLSKRSWSLVIWDVTDNRYSNVWDSNNLPQGVTVDQRSKGANLYLVRPDNVPDFSYGKNTGRMSGKGVQAAMQHMGESFYCYSSLSAWIPDLNRVILIEKEDTSFIY